MRYTTKKRQGNLDRLANTSREPVNPFRALRLREGFTVQAFADKCGVSKQALIRLEQGTYNEPLPSVLDYVVDQYCLSHLGLCSDYAEYQDKQRQRYTRLFGDFPSVWSTSTHPLRQLRMAVGLNPTEVSKALCFPQATLVHWEQHTKLQQSVPTRFVEILRQVGYTKPEVLSLVSAYNDYRRGLLDNDRTTSTAVPA